MAKWSDIAFYSHGNKLGDRLGSVKQIRVKPGLNSGLFEATTLAPSHALFPYYIKLL